MTRTESTESQASSFNGDEQKAAARRGDMNYVQLVGRLTADPESQKTANELVVTRFRVATNVANRTEFHSVVAWRQLGTFIARQFKKGDPIRVDGALHGRTWKTDKGETRRSVEVVADWCYNMPDMSRE